MVDGYNAIFGSIIKNVDILLHKNIYYNEIFVSNVKSTLHDCEIHALTKAGLMLLMNK